MKIDITIINLNCNNIFSIYGLCQNFSKNTKIVSNYKSFNKNTDLIILPGVGAFTNAINTLKKNRLYEKIYEHVKIKNKKVIGICLGMQLLYESSEEFNLCKGFGFLKGKVIKLNPGKESFPNIGWKKINTVNKRLKKFNKKNFYFIHSYHCNPIEKYTITSSIKYNRKDICASVEKNNIIGTQFHPEKSGLDGINLFKNLLLK